jgi:cytochrome oxidase Cu insertion factor (SCO1/SenC/PrrC family)
MAEEITNNSSRNPYTPWFVVAAFVVPVAMAYVIFFFADVTSFTNRGEIFNPVIDVTSLKLKNEKNEIIPEKTLRYKWRFISFVGSDCDEACNQRLHDSRQVHKRFGKDSHRILRVIVNLEPASESLNKLIETEYPDALRMNGDTKTINAAFSGTSKLYENEIYIMDPMGNIMMRFTQEQSINDFQFDMKKLLKASQIG